ncbi:hypothetical protein A3H75_00425 [Candidatus Uhrbacteria bacterium RIFCSPLOWO2_02_FULL_51_9]|uniref:Cupin 2 conserved barrel domain-containing protein n=1 Tax=Candidatus Uhrbacteria bacterium RIFCSPLOWO2_02_FULL_51_9 TaxID=1802410 RepID=A0A1F7VDW9_9BACT|nr:MAG: hypothetical protein A3H75_00425 [Candidatus Uhrbacteria bacterium RIFCSPLOWO2_02_FULL_51_9]
MTIFYRVEVPPPHEDARRIITDCVLGHEVPFGIRQIKIIDFKASGMVVGNHYHTVKSGREEFFIAIGPPDVVLFTYRWRVSQEEVQERKMRAGDACHIVPPCSHSFRVEHPQAKLWGLANMAYDAAHDVPDKLFE